MGATDSKLTELKTSFPECTDCFDKAKEALDKVPEAEAKAEIPATNSDINPEELKKLKLVKVVI